MKKAAFRGFLRFTRKEQFVLPDPDTLFRLFI